MVIGHNIPALVTHLSMKKSDRLMTASMTRLSTGIRIASAKDDPAGLTVSNKLSYQIDGLRRASQNATHGISLIQTAEGALNEIQNMLQRMRELAVKSANDTLATEDREKIQTEIDGLTDEITAAAKRTEFNKIKLLNGEAGRISNSFDLTTAADKDKSIASIYYISDAVSAGTLLYTVSAFAGPAVTGGATDQAAFPPPNIKADGNGILINEQSIKIEPNDTFDSVAAKIKDVCGAVGLYYNIDGSDNATLSTELVGSRQEIVVDGDPALLAIFGLAPGTTTGTDAQIDIDGLYHRIPDDQLATYNAADLIRDTAFDNNRIISADGNQITINASNGQTIRLNLYEKTPGMTDVPMALQIESYGPIKIQIGPNDNMGMDLSIPAVTSETLGLVEYKDGEMYRLLNYTTVQSSTLALEKTDRALSFVSQVRTRLGAYQNRLEQTASSLEATAENTESARSRIRDTDMAAEMTAYTQQNVIFQAGLAILGQANQRPQQLLSLIQP